DHTHCDNRPEPGVTSGKEQNRGDQFHHAGTVSAPWLHAYLGEDINGFRCAREFEEQRLQQNDRCGNPAKPVNHLCGFGDGYHIKFSSWSGQMLWPYTYFPLFSINPGQFELALMRLPFVSLLKLSRTDLLY